jgi:hypothetical protein
MPGCIVKFASGAGFSVGWTTPGELQAVGKPGADSMIYLTSNSATPNPGDWAGIDFFEGTRTTSRFSYCEINYGGLDIYGAVNLDWGGSILMDHTTIKNSLGCGIWTGDHTGYVGGFIGNTITQCGTYPLRISAVNLSKLTSGNTLTGNGTDAIYVIGGGITETGTWKNQGVPFLLAGDVTIGDPSGPVLTIEDGSTVKVNAGLSISLGYTVPAGLVANNVTFTSASGNPQRGDWYGIQFNGACVDAECRLTNCTISYGGGDDLGNVWTYDAIPTITGCNINNSKGWGIYLDGTEYPNPDDLEANNTFSNNLLGNVRRP